MQKRYKHPKMKALLMILEHVALKNLKNILNFYNQAKGNKTLV